MAPTDENPLDGRGRGGSGCDGARATAAVAARDSSDATVARTRPPAGSGGTGAGVAGTAAPPGSVPASAPTGGPVPGFAGAGFAAGWSAGAGSWDPAAASEAAVESDALDTPARSRVDDSSLPFGGGVTTQSSSARVPKESFRSVLSLEVETFFS